MVSLMRKEMVKLVAGKERKSVVEGGREWCVAGGYGKVWNGLAC